tara:strand:+ start:313 stop:930 length:618 start_codon:yes stop_codon:yes gene_type:complete
MKTYNKLIEELLEDSPVNSMGGGYDVGQASSRAGNLAGYDPVLGRTRRRKKIKEMFAGCPVFTVASDDYSKCMHGRMKYERWNKKLNMEEMDNQDIRTYAHKNPGKPVIIKDSTYGTMSYLIPRRTTNESVELDEGKMSEIDAMVKDGKTHEQIAKAMNIHVGLIKKVVKKPMFVKRTEKMTPKEKQASIDYYHRAGKPLKRDNK